jgi:hypothetical protein
MALLPVIGRKPAAVALAALTGLMPLLFHRVLPLILSRP